MFTPDDFGAFTAFAAVGAILAGMGALRFEYAIPLALDGRDALHVARLGLLATLAIAVVVLVASLCFSSAIQSAIGVAPHLQLLLPLYTLGFGGAAVLGQIAIRRQQYKITAQRKLVQSIGTVIAQLGAGVAKLGAMGLSLGYALGQVLAFMSLVGVTGITKGSSTRRDLKAAFSRYRRFPLLLAPSGLLNAAGTHIPALLVVAFFGITVGGWFGLTQRILAAPVGLVGTSLAQVYIGELAAIHRSGGQRAFALFQQVSRALTVAALVLAIALAVLAPTLFPLIFGQQWVSSGHYAQALSLGIAGQLIAAPLSQTLVVSGHLAWQAAWDSGRVVALSAAVLVPAAMGASALTMVWCLGAVQACVYAVLWALCRAAARGMGTPP
ncbi:oligosaccharide flippase family protein [Janibacter hoylei]|uniref:lipopolysaccharide biosynthesis protein n=1 Tax=Janibacter hoylei TaxID=364298 RepID=UPI002237381B|nr:oligosaccharide flippase family protein [Janibacter hoylei]MCW4602534.1 oligosaccharide flippase family protein [Janibacter hoylei]